MDVASKLLYVRQCVLDVACSSPNIVLHGSAAADRYIAPSMRFGETGAHQDIDLLLVVPDGDVCLETLDAFVNVIDTRVAIPAAIAHSVKMMCNGLYTAHIHVHGLHVCDVTLVPDTVDARVRSVFPRMQCVVQLGSSGAKFLTVISYEEVLHRMACIVASRPTVDELPIISRAKNGPAIAKAALRLDRLRVLQELGAVYMTPCAWLLSPAPSLVHPPGEMFSATVPLMPSFWKQKKTVCDAETQTCTDDKRAEKALLENVAAAVQSCLDTFGETASKRLGAVDARIGAVESRCCKLVEVLNRRVRHESKLAKMALARASGVLKSFRTNTFLSATKPVKAMKDMTHLADEITDLVALQRCLAQQDPSLGDYLESYTRITRDLTARCHMPFALFKDFFAEKDAEGCEEEKVMENSRDAAVVNGMKMNMMASFMVFLRMLRISNNQTDDMIRHRFVSHEVWSRASRFAFSLARRTQEMYEFVKPKELCVPIVSAEDGSIEFVVFSEDVESHTDDATLRTMHKTINRHLVPQLDVPDVQYIMHLFDNIIGSITCPLIAHIGQLKETIRVMHMTAKEITTSAKEYTEEFSKNPFIVQVQSVKVAQDEVTALSNMLLDKDVFVWKRRPAAAVSKRKPKSKKKSSSVL